MVMSLLQWFLTWVRSTPQGSTERKLLLTKPTGKTTVDWFHFSNPFSLSYIGQKWGSTRSGVGGNEVPTTSDTSTLLEDLDYNKTWLRSHRCSSNTQIRTVSQSLQWNRKIQCGNSWKRMLTLFELFGV